MWGSASDNDRVYVSNNNFFHLPLDQSMLRGVPNTPGATAPPASANGGMVAALDALTGEIIWSFANPAPQIGDATKNALSQVRWRGRVCVCVGGGGWLGRELGRLVF